MIKLKYRNTNTFLIQGSNGGLLVDTDYAGTLPLFYRAIKKSDIRVKDIKYVLATHYHPDHMGLIGELMEQGVQLLLIDVQKEFVHYFNSIFERDKLPHTPIDDTMALVISCKESREFLSDIGINGEIIHTPSHSEDSVSLILDNGDCFVGDLEPYEYLEAYDDNAALKSDWDKVLSYGSKRVYYAHRPEVCISRI